MRYKNTPKRCLVALMGSALLSSSAVAGTFSTDFNSDVPVGLSLQGLAEVSLDETGNTNTSGVLKLTQAGVGSASGGAIIDEIDPGATVTGFEANFLVHIGRGSGADGMSFFFGDFATAAHSEEGPGTINGLTVVFDVYNNLTVGGVPEAPSIDVKWNNNIIAHRQVGAASAVTGASPIGTLTTIRTQPFNDLARPSVYFPVKIRVEPDGRFSLAYNGTVVYTNLPIFRPITDTTIGGAGTRFGFGARTGGSHDDHWVENLSITTQTNPDAGQPYVTSIAPIALSNAGAGAPASPIGGANIVIRDSTYTINPSSIVLRLNGNVVTPTVTRIKSTPEAAAEDTTVISYAPNGILPPGNQTIRLVYATTSPAPLNVDYTFTAVVGSATTVQPDWAVSSVDTNKPGFKARVYQMEVPRAPGDQNLTHVGERQIAKGYIDPATGQPYPDVSELDTTLYPLDANGYFDIPGVINFNQTADAVAGLIHINSTPSRPDLALPGLNSILPPDNIVYEFLTYVYLPAGGHRLGVHADDRVRMSIGPAFQASGSPVLIATTAANSETLANVLVLESGYYPLRIGFWEGGGDGRIELFSVEPGTGRRILLNDPELPSLKTYRESTVSRPSIARVLPTAGWIGASPEDDITIDVRDGSFALDPASVILRINDADQQITTTKSGNLSTITRDSSVTNLLPPGNNNVQFIYGYTDGANAVRLTNNYTFVVAPYYGVLPPANKVAAGTINTADTGFNLRINQIDRSLNVNQAEGGRIAGGGDGNRMPWPEVHLNNGMINPTNGLPYPNLAQPGPNGNWTYTAEVLNFNAPQQLDGTLPISGNGLFHATQPPTSIPGARPEEVMPGLPGGGTSPAANANPAVGTISPGSDNYVMEATTYLDLKAGIYVFGVNSDDGFVVTSAPNPRDTLGTILGFASMGRGNSGTIGGMTLPAGQSSPQITQGANAGTYVFSVIVPEDGIYPFRILYWQGGGGVNVEFFTMNRLNGRVLLVGDHVANPDAVPAYRTYTGPDKPWTKFSVSPTPWDNRFQQAGPGPITMLGRTRAAAGANDIHNFSDAARPWADIAIGGIVANGTAEPTLRLLLNGTEVPATKTTNGTDVTVSYRPNPPLPSASSNVASLVYADTTNSWGFTVQSYTTLSADDAEPATAADESARGFSVKIVQASAARPGGNTAAAAEGQLAGSVANVAPAGPEEGGRYIVTNIINWSTSRVPGFTGAETGNFQDNTYGAGWPWPDYPDAPVPALPGTGLTGNPRIENVAAEIFAYLDLPRAGYYRFGGNADDGIVVKVGTPGETNGTVIFTQDRGAGNQDIPFSFVAPEAGLYPIRFIWYQGGGGGSVEFFSYDDSGKKIAVNDPNDPNAIKAYYRISDAGVPDLTVTRASNGDITITWTNGGTLQSKADLNDPAPWTDLENDGSYTTTPSAPHMFFRVVK